MNAETYSSLKIRRVTILPDKILEIIKIFLSESLKIYSKLKKRQEYNSADGIRKGPGGAIPARRGSLTKTKSAPVGSSTQSEDADEDCLQRFLKIKVRKRKEELEGWH